jgi:hypothetical protein
MNRSLAWDQDPEEERKQRDEAMEAYVSEIFDEIAKELKKAGFEARHTGSLTVDMVAKKDGKEIKLEETDAMDGHDGMYVTKWSRTLELPDGSVAEISGYLGGNKTNVEGLIKAMSGYLNKKTEAALQKKLMKSLMKLTGTETAAGFDVPPPYYHPLLQAMFELNEAAKAAYPNMPKYSQVQKLKKLLGELEDFIIEIGEETFD